MIAESNKLPLSTVRPALGFSGFAKGRMTSSSRIRAVPAILADGFHRSPSTRRPRSSQHASALRPRRREHHPRDRNPRPDIHRPEAADSRAAARRAMLLPIVERQLHADMTRDGVADESARWSNRRVPSSRGSHCRNASRVRMSEGLPILVHQVDDGQARAICALLSIAIRRGNRSRSRQRHAERFRQRVHGRSPCPWCYRSRWTAPPRPPVARSLDSRSHPREHAARFPDDRARTDAASFVEAIEHRPPPPTR